MLVVDGSVRSWMAYADGNVEKFGRVVGDSTGGFESRMEGRTKERKDVRGKVTWC